ncbi:MAG: HAD family phosphatase [Chloroflexi bacterium]|nr:HAD family phosphatase [Chloroflexota bacterium]
MRSSRAQRSVPTVAAVIFDLDGVLVDSEIWWHQERVAWAASMGLAWTAEDSRAVMGANSRGWARIMRERLHLDLADEIAIERAIVGRVVARYAAGAPEIPGAVAAVEAVTRRWPTAIASSAHRDVIAAALRATGLARTIPIVVSSDEVAHGKPAPDVYLEAARRLEVEPLRCVVVEDSLNGVRAGVAAGMAVVLIPNESVPPAAGTRELADVVVERLADLDPVEALAAAVARKAGRLTAAASDPAPGRADGPADGSAGSRRAVKDAGPGDGATE